MSPLSTMSLLSPLSMMKILSAIRTFGMVSPTSRLTLLIPC